MTEPSERNDAILTARICERLGYAPMDCEGELLISWADMIEKVGLIGDAYVNIM